MRILGKGEKLQRGHVNQSVRALEHVGRRLAALEQSGAPGTVRQLRAFGINNTGADLRMGDCARVSGATTLTINQMLESGQAGILELAGFGTSVDPDDPPLVIACNAIKDGEAGEVFVTGICPARCEGTGAFAGAPESGAVLARAASGSVRVLQEGADTVAAGGEKWCLVLLGAGQAAGGGGGTATLPASTDYAAGTQNDIEIPISSETTLAQLTAPASGNYLLAGCMEFCLEGAENAYLYLKSTSLGTLTWVRSPGASGQDTLNFPAMLVTLAEDEVVTLSGLGYKEGGGGSPFAIGYDPDAESPPYGIGPTFLSMIGPLAMAVA